MNLIFAKPNILIDWATYESAKFACLNWHYSRSIPCGKLVKVGVWENGIFIGVVIFSRGANNHIGQPYKLTAVECCELTRIALRTHSTPVSKILSIAIKFLQKQSIGIRLIVSYADTAQKHHGGIYQATNWTYVGATKIGTSGIYNGKVVHRRTLSSLGVKGYKTVISMPKHKYLMPLDAEMCKQIHLLAQPYPKREKEQDSRHPLELGGATPTLTLQ